MLAIKLSPLVQRSSERLGVMAPVDSNCRGYEWILPYPYESPLARKGELWAPAVVGATPKLTLTSLPRDIPHLRSSLANGANAAKTFAKICESSLHMMADRCFTLALLATCTDLHLRKGNAESAKTFCKHRQPGPCLAMRFWSRGF